MTAENTTPGKKFVYGNSCKIINWGYCFDSLLEVKYALSIQHEYQFLRSRITIIYDRLTKQPVRYALRKHGHYTPDFLIRHKQTYKAYWIEIKPRAFNDKEQLKVRKEVAENYIRQHNYDWEFKIIYDDEIILSLDLIAQFNECCKLINKPLDKNKIISLPAFFATPPNLNRVEWIMFGNEK